MPNLFETITLLTLLGSFISSRDIYLMCLKLRAPASVPPWRSRCSRVVSTGRSSLQRFFVGIHSIQRTHPTSFPTQALESVELMWSNGATMTVAILWWKELCSKCVRPSRPKVTVLIFSEAPADFFRQMSPNILSTIVGYADGRGVAIDDPLHVAGPSSDQFRQILVAHRA